MEEKRSAVERLARIRISAVLRILRVWLRIQHRCGGPDLLDEVAYWEMTLSKAPSWIASREQMRRAFPDCLAALAQTIGSENSAPVPVLEVGSGPVSILAAAVADGLIHVTAIDPLAHIYRLLLKKYHLSYPIEPVRGTGETIANQFEAGKFALVYSSNALDHTASPRRCVEQMVRVLRPGGAIYLEGFVREGSSGGWAGLHQYDLAPETGVLACYDRAGQRIDLTTGLGLTCFMERVTKFRHRGIDAFGYELPPGTPDNASWNWQNRDWFTLIFQLA